MHPPPEDHGAPQRRRGKKLSLIDPKMALTQRRLGLF
jgi:hypothetical protein